MEFGLLGPLVVRRGPELVPVKRGNQRAVLAALLLSANRTVLVADLAELLWGFDPPPSAQITVQNYVKRLRNALGPPDRERISTQPRGYLIRVADDELDVTRFEALLAAAQAASRAGDWPTAASRARAAISLCRGEPLADIEADLLVQREAPRLAEMRLLAAETSIDADLHLGRHAEVIGELRQLVAVHPLRERFHGLLIRALAASGRTADALAAYQDARQVLVAELGTEPGQELRELHRAILATTPLDQKARGAGSGPGQSGDAEPVPRQLPAPVQQFAGRSGELAALTQLLDRPSQPEGHVEGSRTMLISAIDGTAGVGKTALAVQWAHQVADRFPDGQLYVNLRGYDPGRPLAAIEALAGFLRALGVPGQGMPTDCDERAALYRSTLAGRSVLVVLDNARDLEQVRPLLPGTASSVAVVTSRDSLAGLVAREGARRLDLDTLPAADALSLLGSLIGTRVDTEPAAASVLAEQCARLPLALRVAAELAASRPEATIAELTSELGDYQRRLDLLEAGGDPRTAVRAVFSWSLRHLDRPAAEAFRLLGSQPAADWDDYALAALTGATLEQAAQLMARLTRANLIQAIGDGRYGMHDLLRAYARELASEVDAERRRAALTRLFDYYLRAASAAMDTMFPAEKHRRPQLAAADIQLPSFAHADEARAWLDARLAGLTAVVAHEAAYGWHGEAIMTAATLFRYLEIGGHDTEAQAMHGHALMAAQLEGDGRAEATARLGLGVTAFRRMEFDGARKQLELALELARKLADRAVEARTVANLGAIALRMDQYDVAESYFREAIRLHRASGDQAGEANVRGNLGVAALHRSDYDKAAGHLRRALTLYRRAGNRSGEARCVGALGLIDLQQGRPLRASKQLRASLALCRQLGDRIGEAHDLANLGVAEFQLGHYAEAEEQLRAAITSLAEVGDDGREITAHNELGELLAGAGRTSAAQDEFWLAIAQAERLGLQPDDVARAHVGLGRCYQAFGENALAREHWQIAIAGYTELNDIDKADETLALAAQAE